MNTATRIMPAVAGIMLALAAQAAETEEPRLEETAQSSRWRISAGARLAPGVKTSARISSAAAVGLAGRLPAGRSSRCDVPAEGMKTTTTTSSSDSSESVTEAVAVGAGDCLKFDNGFINMDDDAGVPGQTSNWHFDDASAFGGADGSLRGTTTTTTQSPFVGMGAPVERPASFTSERSTRSEKVFDDVASSSEEDFRGADFEIGYDFWRGDRLSLGVGLGASFYRGEDAVRAAGRCYEATATTVRETHAGRHVSSTGVSGTTTTTTTEETIFQDENLAGSLSDILNDDGSIGAGTPDGYTNPYGGNNPVLTVSDGSVTKTTTVDTHTETTTTQSEGFVLDKVTRDVRRQSQTIDVIAEGDVETQEIRLALQPAWKATDWLEFRGSFGAVATRVSVDADATVLVNGARFTTVSGDDSDWVFAGLCGLDAVVSPLDRLSLFVGADIRLGGNTFDYEAGLVRGSVELARATYRAGVAISF